jgi:aspartyl-tRNA(Asn)/glutamyl-tRNA(Gln) amidotransferase subunit A
MNTLAFASIGQLQRKLAANEISPDELLSFFLRRFEMFDAQLGSALEVFDKKSLHALQQQGALAGIPGIFKNNIAIRNRKLTCGSKILEHFVSPYDATVTERLAAHGGISLGRANMDEFAMGSSTETSAYKKAHNPWNLAHSPGGSSGGSAVAVAAGLVPWALGSETGGSVRHPAALCGIVGLKPTYGLVSRYGLVAYGSSVDQIGVFSRTVADNALILSLIAGHDERDSSSLQERAKNYAHILQTMPMRPMTIGVVKNAIEAEGIDAEVSAALSEALQQLQKLGHTIQEVTLPAIEYSAAAYFIISRAEATSNLARFDGVRYGFRDETAHTLSAMYKHTRAKGFGTEVKKRIIVGSYVLSAGHSDEYYQNAQQVRQCIAQEFKEAFASVDVLFMPTHPAPAFKIGEFAANPLQMDLQDYFTCPINLAGIPAISIPCGFSRSGLPIGMQFVGPHNGEEHIFAIAHQFEQATEWHLRHPKDFC